MRILLKLKAEKDCEYDLKYYHKMQGFIYNLLKETEYGILHDKHGYKFFCFSNIFPIGDMKSNDTRSLLISSPDNILIKFLKEQLGNRIKENNMINIGEMSFSIEKIYLINTRLRNNTKIISATPIIIRIPDINYEKYGIDSDKKYIYWRPEYDFNAFIKQLEENLFKKYNEFYKTDIEEFLIFEQFIFKKIIVNHVIIDDIERKTIGSIWEFIFTSLQHDNERRKLLEFGIDTGFGERNSLGFGFVNVVRI